MCLHGSGIEPFRKCFGPVSDCTKSASMSKTRPIRYRYIHRCRPPSPADVSREVSVRFIPSNLRLDGCSGLCLLFGRRLTVLCFGALSALSLRGACRSFNGRFFGFISADIFLAVALEYIATDTALMEIEWMSFAAEPPEAYPHSWLPVSSPGTFLSALRSCFGFPAPPAGAALRPVF